MGRPPGDQQTSTEVTATEAARNFASLLDGVEHRREAFTIVRRGRTIAQLQPVDPLRGIDLKAVLRRRAADPQWAQDLAAGRSGPASVPAKGPS